MNHLSQLLLRASVVADGIGDLLPLDAPFWVGIESHPWTNGPEQRGSSPHLRIVIEGHRKDVIDAVAERLDVVPLLRWYQNPNPRSLWEVRLADLDGFLFTVATTATPAEIAEHDQASAEVPF